MAAFLIIFNPDEKTNKELLLSTLVSVCFIVHSMFSEWVTLRLVGNCTVCRYYSKNLIHWKTLENF